MADEVNGHDKTGVDTTEHQPGAVISPGSHVDEVASEPQKVEQIEEPQQEIKESEQSISTYQQPDDSTQITEYSEADGMSWVAPEFIAHDKTSKWYIYLTLICVAISIALYLLTKDYITIGIIVFSAFLLAYYSAHKPQNVEYKIDEDNISIGNKHFNYSDFRFFTVYREGNYENATLMPLKRFALTASLYFEKADEEKIVKLLTDKLPYEEHKPDLLDRFMHQIHF